MFWVWLRESFHQRAVSEFIKITWTFLFYSKPVKTYCVYFCLYHKYVHVWSLWKIVNLSWSQNQNFQGEFCHCFSVIADATAAAAAAAKRRQNGGGGEPKSYRVTISAPIIFHCRSTTLYKTRRRNFSNEWVWKNTILRSGDAILWTCDKYLILQANREKFATWSHPPAAPPPPPPPPSAAAAMLAPTLLKNWYTLFAQSDYSVPKRVHFLIKKNKCKKRSPPVSYRTPMDG